MTIFSTRRVLPLFLIGIMLSLVNATPLPPDAEAKIGKGLRESLSQQQSTLAKSASTTGNPSAQVVIALHKPKTQTRMARDINDMQTTVLKSIKTKNGYTSLRTYSNIPAMTGTIHSEQALKEVALNPHVKKVDLDVGGSGTLKTTTTMEWFLKQLSIHGIKQTRHDASTTTLTQSATHIGADKRHAVCNTGEGVVIAVLDSGVDADHDNLHQSIVAEACFADDKSADGGKCPDGSNNQIGHGAANDDAGHGTFVAGVITSNGTKGGSGIAPDAGIVAVKVTHGPGFAGSFSSFSQILAGLDYIISNPQLGVKIINMSIATRTTFDGDCDDEASWTMVAANAIQTLRERGVVAFASAGNNGSNEMAAPACLSGVIAVGASDIHDNPADFTDSNASTDLFAPGVSVESSTLNNGLKVSSGTSFSSPKAAACAALLVESGEASTPVEIENRLKTSNFSVTRNGITFPRLDCSPSQTQLETLKKSGEKCPKDNKSESSKCKRCSNENDRVRFLRG